MQGGLGDTDNEGAAQIRFSDLSHVSAKCESDQPTAKQNKTANGYHKEAF